MLRNPHVRVVEQDGDGLASEAWPCELPAVVYAWGVYANNRRGFLVHQSDHATLQEAEAARLELAAKLRTRRRRLAARRRIALRLDVCIFVHITMSRRSLRRPPNDGQPA